MSDCEIDDARDVIVFKGVVVARIAADVKLAIRRDFEEYLTSNEGVNIEFAKLSAKFILDAGHIAKPKGGLLSMRELEDLIAAIRK